MPRYRFVEHIPNFVSGGTPVEIDFDNMGEVVRHRTIAGFRKMKQFEYFYVYEASLMARVDGSYWCVGKIYDLSRPEPRNAFNWYSFGEIAAADQSFLNKQLSEAGGKAD